MKKLMRLFIKTALIVFILILASSIKLIVEGIMQSRLGALEMVILFGGAGAAIRAIYKYEGKSSEDSNKTVLNKNLDD
ncbi:hypothetical protein [Vibrio rarus]|uniref:hypothetical protein n=1 Tax=Vibrio rarus TaxID=413403 RepID=UPI0021C2CDD4|nr:hypothetical protein [Vibrio rarus]